MSEFDKTANAILKRLNENFVNSADDDEKEDEEKKKDKEEEEELNSIREAYGLPPKKKGPHGEKPKLNCRSVHSL